MRLFGRLPLLLSLPLALSLGQLCLCGCGLSRHISEQAFRHATGRSAEAELAALGYRMRGSLSCALPPGNTLAVVRVRCTGRTTEGEAVTVTGIAREADTRNPRQDFVLTVGGRRVLRAPCLGRGCHKATASDGQFAGKPVRSDG